MLVNLHGYAERDSFGGHIHTDQFRLASGKINHAYSSSQDAASLSLFFRDAKAARELARKINAVADSIESASIAKPEAAE